MGESPAGEVSHPRGRLLRSGNPIVPESVRRGPILVEYATFQIRQTIGEDLPPGFQRAEFVQQKGFVDLIIHRKQIRTELARLLEFFWRSTRGFAAEGKNSPHHFVAEPRVVEELAGTDDGA